MIDAHNHLQDPRFAGRQAELVTEMKQAGVTGCVVNGTGEHDWPDVAMLAETFPGFVIPSFGLHPWKVAERSPDWLSKLREYLTIHPDAPIGECGLDRWMDSPDPEVQQEVFRAHLELAVALERPLTIHCLKAWGPLLDELQNAPTLPKILLHSYGGSLEFARQCLELGAHFSFSGYFLQPRKTKTRDVFIALPSERILVESDAPDMLPPDPEFPLDDLNHPANLIRISRLLGELTGNPPSLFDRNARRFFGKAIVGIDG